MYKVTLLVVNETRLPSPDTLMQKFMASIGVANNRKENGYKAYMEHTVFTVTFALLLDVVSGHVNIQ